MKKFTRLFENNINNYNSYGVSNHYTPVENILTNIKNLYCVHLGIVASIGEDGISIKLTSSRFATEEDCNRILCEPIYKNLTLYQYINSQGLNGVKYVDLGKCFVVYFYPTDVVKQSPNTASNESLCDEMISYKIDECELKSINIYEDNEDEEITDEISREKVLEIIKMKDKVKAAKLLGALINDKLEIPSDYYFAGVKTKDGHESIALRWKYIKRAPFGKSIECVKSIINIFDNEDNNVWIGDFDKDGYFKLPTETNILIESILKLLNAISTKDPCVYSIEDDLKDKDKDKKSDDNSTDNSDDNADDNKDDSKDNDSDKNTNLLK